MNARTATRVAWFVWGLDSLSTDLVAVVRTTMQPAHVTLWLRGSGATRSRARE